MSAVLLGLLGCLGEPVADAGQPERQTLTVLAASSLTDAFADLERVFEARHPQVDVVVSVAGSQTLATQVRHGLRADVLASADSHHIAELWSEGLASVPLAFAANELVLAVHEGVHVPAGLEQLPSLERLVVGADQVPVGRYTDALLDAAEGRYGSAWRASVEDRVVSREPNVRLVAAKVGLGEADAALVYATDVAATDGLRPVELPEDLRPDVGCFHALVVGSASPQLALSWMDFVESAEGQQVLAARGFRAASSGS